jgi:hypothetical protein
MWTSNMSFALILAALIVTVIGWSKTVVAEWERKKRFKEHKNQIATTVHPFDREYFEMYCSLMRHVETLKSCEE